MKAVTIIIEAVRRLVRVGILESDSSFVFITLNKGDYSYFRQTRLIRVSAASSSLMVRNENCLFICTCSRVPRPRPDFRRLQYGIFRLRGGRAWERGLWYECIPILPYLCAMQYFHISL